MQKTSIEWVRNPDGSQGYTFNPITGCLNNCPYCYARKLANGRLRTRYLANKNVAPNRYLNTTSADGWRDPFYPRFWKDKLAAPYSVMRTTKSGYQYWGQKPKGIFACDMADLFGIGIPWQWQAQIFQAFVDNPQHRFYLLTKQPQNLAKWSPFPDNCWVGFTATDDRSFHDGLAYYLSTDNYKPAVEAKIRFISFEPLLGRVKHSDFDALFFGGDVDWVIIGDIDTSNGISS